MYMFPMRINCRANKFFLCLQKTAMNSPDWFIAMISLSLLPIRAFFYFTCFSK